MEQSVDIATELSVDSATMDEIGIKLEDVSWLRLPKSDNKRCQAERPTKRTRGNTSPLRERILKNKEMRQKQEQKKSAEAAALKEYRGESSEEDTPGDKEIDMKRRKVVESLEDQLHQLDSGCHVPADSFLGWGEDVFGLQKTFPKFVMTREDKDTVSRALKMNLSSGPESTFALEGMVLRGLIPHRITLDGLSGAIVAQWMFHQLTYSTNRALRAASCKLFCSLLRPIQDGKRSYKCEWHLTYEHIMTALENFGYTPAASKDAGCDGNSAENRPDSGKSDGNAMQTSAREDAVGVGVSVEVAVHLEDEGTVPDGRLDGDESRESRERPAELAQSEISSLERDSESEAPMKLRAEEPPSNIRSFLRFLIAYFKAQKSKDAFQVPEAENLVVTLFRMGLDRRTTGVADLLQSSIEALVSCFEDAEWPFICERIAISLSRVGSTLQNNMRIATNGPENPRFVDLRRRVVLLLLSSLDDLETGISNAAGVVSLFKNVTLKERECDFPKLYNMLVLADTYLWSCDSFKQGKASEFQLWQNLLKRCAHLKIIYDQPDAMTVRQWASLKTKNYEDEAKSRPEELNGNTEVHEEHQVKDDSEIEDL